MSDIISFKGELEFSGCHEDDRSGRTVRFRIVKRPEDQGLAHPFAGGRRRKAKIPGTRFFSTFASVQSGDVVHFGETMLLGWTDGPGGSFVTLLLDNESDAHPFLGYSRASRGAPGTRFMGALAEIDDDETPRRAEPEPEKHEHKAGRKTSNDAAILSKDSRFHDWLNEHVRTDDWTEKSADDWIKGVCRISSKRELDADSPALERYLKLVVKPYQNWLAEQGYYGV